MTIACWKADGNVPESSEEFITFVTVGMTVGAMAWSRCEGTVLSRQVVRWLPMSSNVS